VDSFQTRLHKRDMQAALKRHGWSIAQGDLVSGPGKTIKASRGAIQKHAS
jgi:lambda repressor-like predicted transcriptional regulator